MPIFKKGFVVVLMLLWQDLMGQNLVINGNFESGNLVGFSSNYTFIPGPTGSTIAGQYAIGQNPQPYNTASFFSMGDHTSGRGNMMIVDGTNNGGNTDPTFWRINNNGEICGLTVGETYTFSYYVKSIYRDDIAGATSADIGIKWNNVLGQSALGIILPISGNMLVLPPVADWQQVTYQFVPTNACVRIEMFDRNSNQSGNDFSIDDIELLPPFRPLQLSYAIIPPDCPDANDGFIAGYARGGKAPYTYSLNGRPFSSTLLLTGLGVVSGQFITVRDASSPPTEVSVSNINVTAPVNPLDAGPNGTVCAGQFYQLHASGGSSYSWTATPEDTSLTTSNIANPLVKPLVNTIYTVTSQVNMVRNLIFNGDFSEGSSGGNVGFGSDYIHRHANQNGVQGIYAIVPNAQTFQNDLPACTGTGGIGDQMFVADGSTKMDTKVWWQEVPVQPNTLYTFTYYLQSVNAASPAIIETRINNQPITGTVGTSTQTAPNTTCTWQQVTYTWNSGASTSAFICLFNRNLESAGNDFALDDISFSTNSICTFSRQVIVNVSREETPKIDVLIQPDCRNTTGSFRIVPPVPAGTDLEYAVDGINFQDESQFSNLLPGTYSAVYRRKSTGCISQPFSVAIIPFTDVRASVTLQPTCNNPFGTIEITSPIGPGLEYSVDGTTWKTDFIFSGLTPKRYTVSVRNTATGCNSEVSLVVNTIQDLPPTAPLVNNPVTHCQFSNGIQPLMADGTNLKWYNVATGGTGSSIAPVPGAVTAGTSIWYVSQTNASGCESPRSAITVNIAERPVITIPVKTIEIQAGQSVSLPATITGQTTIRWTPATGLNNPKIEQPLARPEHTTTYTLLASTAQACSASDTIRVIVLKEIIIPNVFSPNGDGINDKWVIRHIEDYQHATITVFDRYGKRIYSSNNVAIPWDGTVTGKQVPAGTYYYIIKLESNKTFNGAVTVLR